VLKALKRKAMIRRLITTNVMVPRLMATAGGTVLGGQGQQETPYNDIEEDERRGGGSTGPGRACVAIAIGVVGRGRSNNYIKRQLGARRSEPSGQGTKPEQPRRESGASEEKRREGRGEAGGVDKGRWAWWWCEQGERQREGERKRGDGDGGSRE
jgi:hypothetical protein